MSMAGVNSKAWKRQKRDFETVTFVDLPYEIILKIFESVNIKDLFRCMAVNKKFRAIANDQSLWNKMHLTGTATFPPELISQIISKGCQYLSFYNCRILKKNVRFEKNYQLKFLCILNCLEYDAILENPWDSFDILPDFAASCYGLEKLSIICHNRHLKSEDEEICKDPQEPRINRIEAKFFKCIIQNCDTLRVLELTNFELSLESVQRIFSLCQELTELKFGADYLEDRKDLCEESVDFISNNLSTKIEKLDISYQTNFGDEQIKTLLKRCNRLTELALMDTDVSDKSVKMIIKTLSETLVKLDVGNNFSFQKKLELASMPKLQVLANSSSSDENKRTRKKQDRIIRKMLPLMTDCEFCGFSDYNYSGELKIAEPYPHETMFDFNWDQLVPNGFWEIKSKQRTYNGFSKLCKSCGVVCKCASAN